MYPVVLLAVALDLRDADVLEALAALAPAIGLREVHLIHVHAVDPMVDPLMGGLPVETITQAAPQGLSGLAQDLSDRLEAQGVSGVAVHPVYARGRPHEEVARLADATAADLVVIGRLRAVDGDEAWGSRGQLIARHARRPVLVVPHQSRLRRDDVVVGLDFSPRSLEALQLACALGERVRAVYVLRTDPGVSYAGLSPREYAERIRRNADKHFREDFLPRLPAEGTTPELEVIEAERVSDVLIELGERAGLFVIGSRGLSPLASVLLGSTAQRVAGFLNAPVLIARNKGEDVGVVAGLLKR